MASRLTRLLAGSWRNICSREAEGRAAGSSSSAGQGRARCPFHATTLQWNTRIQLPQPLTHWGVFGFPAFAERVSVEKGRGSSSMIFVVLFCFLSLKINLATLQISLRKAARLLEDCSHCFNLLKESWWPKSKTHQGLSETLRLLGFMDLFSTWQRELDSNASQQRHQMATAVYRVCTRGTHSFLLAISSLTSQARKWSYCLGEYKRLQQKVLSPTCLLSGKITKRFVLAVGFLPRAEFLCSTQWHNAAASLPLKHKLHEKNPSEWMSQEKSSSV